MSLRKSSLNPSTPPSVGEVIDISIALAPNGREVFLDDAQGLAGFFREDELEGPICIVNQLVCSPFSASTGH